MELVFKPLLAHHFPTGTSVTIYDKDIDTRSFRKFATTYLRKGKPKIELGIRQAFFGHARTTTLEDMYEDDPSLDELRIVTRRTICGNISDEAKAMLKPLGAEYFDSI